MPMSARSISGSRPAMGLNNMASALELKGVSAGYGETVVLEDINLSVAADRKSVV